MAKRKRSNNVTLSTTIRKKLRTITNFQLNRTKIRPVSKPSIIESKPITTVAPRISPTEMKSCAVLVDAENISHRWIRWIVQKLESMGYNAYIRRAYGDFSGNHSLCAWRTIEKEFQFKQIQAHKYVSGKNTSDFAMMIGAMDMLHNRNGGKVIQCFVLVTSDSDFTPLVKRLRESQKEVLGFGGAHSPKALVNEYNRFFYIESTTSTKTHHLSKQLTKKQEVQPPSNVASTKTSHSSKQLTKKKEVQPPSNVIDQQPNTSTKTIDPTEELLVQLLTNVINQQPNTNGWVALSAICPYFPCRDYGYPTITQCFAVNTGHFELNRPRRLVRIRPSDDQDDQQQSYSTEKSSKKLSDKGLIQHLTKIIRCKLGINDGWASLSHFHPYFRCKDYGYSKVSKYFEANADHFEVDKARSLVRIRLADDQKLSRSKDAAQPLSKEHLIQHLVTAINLQSNEDGWAELSTIGGHFPYEDHGYSKVCKYFEANTGDFELDKARGLVRIRCSETQQRSCTVDSMNGLSRSCSADEINKQRFETAIRFQSDRDGWANLSDVRKHFPGKEGIREYLEVNTEHFQLDSVKSLVRIRLSDDQQSAGTKRL